MSKMPFTQAQGGQFKIVDSSTFPISQTIASVEVMVEVGGLRELHVSFCHVDSAGVVSDVYPVAPHSNGMGPHYVRHMLLHIRFSHLMDSDSSGFARMTLFIAGSRARTFDYVVRFQS